MPILDNFDYDFIEEVSQTNHGLMSPYDKTKLDNIQLSDIEYINTELEKINESLVPQFVYGIKINPAESNPNNAVTYTDNSIGFIPLKVDQTTGVCNYGSWENIINTVLGIRPCLMKRDGTIVAYLNPNDYTKTIDGNTIDIGSGDLGQVMISFNHVYYRFSVDQGSLWFQISNKQNDSTWVDTAFACEDGIGTVKKQMYVSAYESTLKNNTVQSLSGHLPSINLTFEELETLSDIALFNMMNITKKQFITFLGYLVTKSIDLEGNIGIGNISSTVLNTGTMNTKGLFYGKSTTTDGVKMFGIENFYGNQLKYMHGIIQKQTFVINTDTSLPVPEQHLYIKEFYPYNKIEDFSDMGIIESNVSGFISSIRLLSDSVYIPDALEGSSSTYFKSFFRNGTSTDNNNKLYGVYGGNTMYGDQSGPEFLLLAYLPDSVQVTTHLIY